MPTIRNELRPKVLAIMVELGAQATVRRCHATLTGRGVQVSRPTVGRVLQDIRRRGDVAALREASAALEACASELEICPPEVIKRFDERLARAVAVLESSLLAISERAADQETVREPLRLSDLLAIARTAGALLRDTTRVRIAAARARGPTHRPQAASASRPWRS